MRHIPRNVPATLVAFPLSCSQLNHHFKEPHSSRAQTGRNRPALRPLCGDLPSPCTSWPLVDRQGLQAHARPGSQMLTASHLISSWTGPSPKKITGSKQVKPRYSAQLLGSRLSVQFTVDTKITWGALGWVFPSSRRGQHHVHTSQTVLQNLCSWQCLGLCSLPDTFPKLAMLAAGLWPTPSQP